MKSSAPLFSVNRRLELLGFLAVFGIIVLVYLSTIYPDQGWGDDFAQYISQAANISKGISMAQTGYIYSRYTASLGPVAYPPGFPLLLAPIYALFGVNIGAFQIEILILQLLALVVAYLIYRRAVSIPTAAILLFMLGLSPYLISFKRDVMSDVPFMLLCLLTLFWLEHIRKSAPSYTQINSLVTALLIYFSYFIRTLGLLLLVALILSDVLYYRRITRSTIFTVVYTAVFLIIGRVLFGKGEESYLDQFANYSPLVIISNIGHYFINAIRGFWAGPSIHLGSEIIFPILWLTGIPLMVYGWIRHFRSGTKLLEMFFVIYSFVILAWPSVQELRFLYPVLPLILLYVGIGTEGLLEHLRTLSGQRIMLIAAVVVGLGMVIIYGVRSVDVIHDEHLLTDGPYTANAQELFQFVKDHTENNAIFVFNKPRAFALYTDRHASTFPPIEPSQVGVSYLREIKAMYAVVKKDATSGIDVSNVQLMQLVSQQPEAFEVVFQNADYVVYHINLDSLKQV